MLLYINQTLHCIQNSIGSLLILVAGSAFPAITTYVLYKLFGDKIKGFLEAMWAMYIMASVAIIVLDVLLLII